MNDDYKGNGPTIEPPDDPRSGGTGGGGGGTGGGTGSTGSGSVGGTGHFISGSPTIPKPTKSKSPFSGGHTPPPTDPEPIETSPLPGYTPQIVPNWPPESQPEQPNGRTDVVVPITEPLPFIYGATRCGGQVVYEKVLSDGSKLVMWNICWGPINSISNVMLDGKAIATYGGSTNIYLGTRTQTVDALMAAAEPTWTSGKPGIAMIVAKLPKPTSTQPGPNVRTMTCDVQGMLVRDPRSDATLTTRFYRDNNTLCTTDYESNINFGRGRDIASIDWSGSITTSANDCDFDIGGGTKRFTIGLWGGDQKDSDQWVNDLRATAQLVVVENSGLWQIWMDKAQSAAAVTLTDAGVGIANIITAGPIQVSGARQVWTRVRVNFVNVANGYKDDFAEDPDPRIALGLVPDIYQAVDLRGVPSFDQAKRLAKYLRKRSALDKTVPLKLLQDGGIQLLPGVRVPVTASQLNWSAVDTLITQCTPNAEGGFDATVELYTASVYDDTIQTTTSYAPPINPSPYDAPPAPYNIHVDPNLGGNEIKWRFWLPPAAALTTQNYGTGFYTQSGCGNYDGTKVSDGVTNVKAFDVNVAADSTLTIDFGTPKNIQQVVVWTFRPGAGVPGGFSDAFRYVEYSDNGSVWTTLVDITSGTTPTAGFVYDSLNDQRQATNLPQHIGFNDSGAGHGPHRYWRLRKGSSVAVNTDVYEVEWYEAGAVNPYVAGLQVFAYDAINGVGRPLITIPKEQITSDVAVDLSLSETNWMTLPTWGVTNTPLPDGTITVVGGFALRWVTEYNVAGASYVHFAQSQIFTAGTAFHSQAEASLALVTGANQNIAADAQSNTITISGPAGGFSIGGISGGRAGRVVTVYYTGAQAMTINNEDVGSTASNRITTFIGGAVTLAAGKSQFTVEYSSVSSRWILRQARDGAGLH